MLRVNSSFFCIFEYEQCFLCQASIPLLSSLHLLICFYSVKASNSTCTFWPSVEVLFSCFLFCFGKYRWPHLLCWICCVFSKNNKQNYFLILEGNQFSRYLLEFSLVDCEHSLLMADLNRLLSIQFDELDWFALLFFMFQVQTWGDSYLFYVGLLLNPGFVCLLELL